MAYAPLAGQDSGSPTTDLPDGPSGIFLREGLDDPNHIESAREIRADAHVGLGIRPPISHCRLVRYDIPDDGPTWGSGEAMKAGGDAKSQT